MNLLKNCLDGETNNRRWAQFASLLKRLILLVENVVTRHPRSDSNFIESSKYQIRTTSPILPHKKVGKIHNSMQFWTRKLEQSKAALTQTAASEIDRDLPLVLVLPGMASQVIYNGLSDQQVRDRKQRVAQSLKGVETILGGFSLIPRELQMIMPAWKSAKECWERVEAMKAAPTKFYSADAEFLLDSIISPHRNAITILGSSYGTVCCQEIANLVNHRGDSSVANAVMSVCSGTLIPIEVFQKHVIPGAYFYGSNDQYIAQIIPGISEKFGAGEEEVTFAYPQKNVALIHTPIPNTVVRWRFSHASLEFLIEEDKKAHYSKSYTLAGLGSRAHIKGEEIATYHHSALFARVLNTLVMREKNLDADAFLFGPRRIFQSPYKSHENSLNMYEVQLDELIRTSEKDLTP